MKAILASVALSLSTLASLSASGSHADHDHADHAGHDHSAHAAAAPVDLAKVVATVNGTTITMGELQAEQQMMQRGQQGGQPQDINQTLEMLIGRTLLVEQVHAQKMTISDDVLDAEIDKIEQRFGTAEAFAAQLKAQGVEYSEMKTKMKEGMLVQQLIEKNAKFEPVTDQSIQAFYDENPNFFSRPEQVRASHILLKVKEDGSDKDTVTAKLVDLKARAEKGENFATLAKENSEGPSAPRGGDLGLFGRGRMVPAFETSAFSMKAGEVSDVIETQFGLHILKVFEKFDAGVTPLAEIKDRLQGYLENMNRGKATQAYVESLRSAAKVDVTL
jgi:peptidyl-prolyl cis-trans isomerase C